MIVLMHSILKCNNIFDISGNKQIFIKTVLPIIIIIMQWQ